MKRYLLTDEQSAAYSGSRTELVEYTNREGGRWKPLFHDSLFEVAEELERPENWVELEMSEHNPPGHRKRTLVLGVLVASVRFPDGRVWDSYFRGWRITGKEPGEGGQ